MERNWSDSTVVILTCDRDKELMDLCRQGIELFWPGINLAVLHDKDADHETPLPDDIRELCRKMVYLRKIFDLPYIAETDQLYCLDSDCMLFDEPLDWGPAQHLTAFPGSLGKQWLKQGADIWQALGKSRLDEILIACGGCWSGKRTEMFEPYRDLSIAYIRECVKQGILDQREPQVVMEQCHLNGLWHLAYGHLPAHHLPTNRYPLYQPNHEMAIFHLSVSEPSMAARVGEYIANYKKVLQLKRKEVVA